MKTLKVILLSLFAVIALITLIILIVYIVTFNNGFSMEIENWDLFLTLYNGIVISALTMLNIWIFYQLTIAIEDRNENRYIKSKLYETQKIFTDLRIEEYKNLKIEINKFINDTVASKDVKAGRTIISSILMRMQNSILFCHSNNQATSVLEAPIKQILDNLTENMSENNYLAISRALRTIEFLIFTLEPDFVPAFSIVTAPDLIVAPSMFMLFVTLGLLLEFALWFLMLPFN